MAILRPLDQWLPAADVMGVEQLLRTCAAGCTVPEITARTYLSSLVVIPALERLIAEGSVQRSIIESPDGHRVWAYRLTARRRRELATGTGRED